MDTLHHLHQVIGGQGTLPAGTDNPATLPLGPVVTDTRHVEPGCIYWALAGASEHAAESAEEAFAQGATGAVVGRPVKCPSNGWSLVVEDTHRALVQWAGWKRRQFPGTVIAVTGSVGKTTARQMIHTVLRTRMHGMAGLRHKKPSRKLRHPDLSLPLDLLRLTHEHQYAVLELGVEGSSEHGSMAELCSPQIGVITQIGDTHLGGFGSRIGVAEAKADLLASLPADGFAVLGDDPLVRRLARRCLAPTVWVGRGTECDLTASDVHWSNGRLAFSIEDVPFQVPVWGRHHLGAALLAVAVARLLGIPLQESSAALERFDAMPIHGNVLEIRGATIIHDTGNAHPTAMRAALELLRDFDAPGRRIAVCGDMTDVDSEATFVHRQLGNEIVTHCGADLLIACGEHAQDVVAAARAAGMSESRTIPCRRVDDALPCLAQLILPGDVVLVKGSPPLALLQVVEAMQHLPRRRSA